MENFLISDIEFNDSNINDLVFYLKQCYKDKQECFVKLCFIVHRILSVCKNSYFKAKDNEYYNAYKLLEKFGFDKKSISKYKLSFERYVICYEDSILGNSIRSAYINPIFQEFSSSKLFELLPISLDTLETQIENKLITPTMTVKQIREHIKTLKDGTDKAEKVIEDNSEINEEEIPEAYNPSKEYEFSYFENKTKNQLLNIVWELQKEYQKLKSKSEKKK